jgi:hypothetical protein
MNWLSRIYAESDSFVFRPLSFIHWQSRRARRMNYPLFKEDHEIDYIL